VRAGRTIHVSIEDSFIAHHNKKSFTIQLGATTVSYRWRVIIDYSCQLQHNLIMALYCFPRNFCFASCMSCRALSLILLRFSSTNCACPAEGGDIHRKKIRGSLVHTAVILEHLLHLCRPGTCPPWCKEGLYSAPSCPYHRVFFSPSRCKMIRHFEKNSIPNFF
jgi:hypothetical protein